MIVTKLDSISKDREMISSFGGLDKNILISENFFSEMKNMSGDHYPLASARKGRGSTSLPSNIFAMAVCNTYGTRGDIADGTVQEDVFALVTKDQNGTAWLEFQKEDGTEAKAPNEIGGDADKTTLIAQAGYVYAFPQGIRRAAYKTEIEYLKNEIAVTRTAEKDSDGLSPITEFTMSPCDENGATGDGVTSSRTASAEYTSDKKPGRSTDQLIIVRADGMGVNQYGCTVYVGTDGKVKEIRDWKSETISLTDNDASFALTGHGTARSWLINNFEVGNKVSLSGMVVSVYGSDAYIVVTDKPDAPANGTVWWDKQTGSKYVYSSAYEEWVAYTTNYILLSYSEGGSAGNIDEVLKVTQNGDPQNDGIYGNAVRLPFNGFKEGDAIEICGISEEYDGSYIIASISARGLILNGIVDNIISYGLRAEGDTVTISRKVPKMDFVIECNNRLWGCYYGLNDDGEVINEIYASALGDPTNWYKYQGISTDSWTATVGADGNFTGAICYGGYPIFFKEDAIIRVWGSAPSSFQLASYNYRGVAEGSNKSLAICDETLYYLSYDGVMAYSGSVPVRVSDALGRESYKDGVAGSIGSKYYLSCLDSSENAHLFVFDASLGVWHREDDLRVEQFMRHKTELYMIANGKVITATGGDDSSVEFECVTGDWGLSDPYRKYFNKFIIRALIPYGAELSVYTSYDGGEWQIEGSYTGDGMSTVQITVIPVRCDTMRLRFEGHGQIMIVSIYREITGGGYDTH